MTKYYFSIIFSIFVSSTIVTSLEIDYYWKDYNGVAPNDAFVAVKNPDGTPAVYIGQCYIVNLGTFPATLLPNANSVSITARGYTSTASNNLKILATRTPEVLRWVKINYSDVATLKKLDFILRIVSGGEESNEDVYIGRQINEGSMQIGKVYNVAPYQGLAFPNKDGSERIKIQEFEILLYIPCYSNAMYNKLINISFYSR